MTRASRRLGAMAAGTAAVLIALLAIWWLVADGDGDVADDNTTVCTSALPEGWSVARVWNEALLSAIRLDFPFPTVHARNLFHVSAGMWDAWAAYDPAAAAVYVDEKHVVDDAASARAVAISHAAYRILATRYLDSPGAEESITGFDELMDRLCLDRTDTATEGDTPAAFGNRVAATILGQTLDDGANETDGYTDPTYQPVNPPLVVAERGTQLVDPNRWQPLELQVMVSQTGIPLDDTIQTFVGPHWGGVAPFALAPGLDGRPALDPGPPPLLGDPETDDEFRAAVIEVIEHSATLDPADPATVDIGPATMGNAPLGTYDDAGHDHNPVTGAPYPANIVARGDYGRAVAEFWADGPSSETPPGHWNTLANSVTDSLGGDLRIGGTGPVVDALEWDVKLYLALNGAVHDAAIAAWGAKGHYDYVRPISMIRWMGGLGQATNPELPSFHPDGLSLVEGLVEVVSEASSLPGERHAHLGDHVGEIAIRAWTGPPPDPESDVGGVDWILAVDWVPYQLSTFVTPAFAGYISGHSTFSRAAAEVLAAITGNAFFPGGVGEWTIEADGLEFEAGPSEPITLQWATYADAADEAGRSRLYGGIHVRADDLRGREVGAAAGQDAWELAMRYYDGTIAE